MFTSATAIMTTATMTTATMTAAAINHTNTRAKYSIL